MNPKYLISIVGPTAIGKTALSIALAKYFQTEIISADSRQFYKEMTIGNATPSIIELSTAPHHFIHHKSISETYNVGDFEKEALKKLENLYETHNVAIMVGGSGLYVDAVCNGLDYFPKVDPEIRERLIQDLKLKGLEHLQNQLQVLDPIAFEAITIDNPHRVIRALEICIGTGKAFSSFLNKPKKARKFTTITIGLNAERGLIYERINKRVDLMMASGLLEEVKQLQSLQHLNALNTVGYSELFRYLNGEWTLDFAVAEIKKNSRRYAKRQLTWFRKNEDIIWFDYQTSLEEILNNIEIPKI